MVRWTLRQVFITTDEQIIFIANHIFHFVLALLPLINFVISFRCERIWIFGIFSTSASVDYRQLSRHLCNALNATRAVVRCPCHDVTGNVFFVLSNMARGFENVCEIISNWATEGLERGLAGAVNKQEKKKERNQGENCSYRFENASTGTKASKKLSSLRKGSQFWKYLLDYAALNKWRPRKKFRGSCLLVR